MSTLDSSLKRLGMSEVDLYQLHYPVARHQLNRYLDAMAETVKSGKAKAVGVSNFNTELMKHAHDYFAKHNIRMASNQIGYNLLYRFPETNGMLEACEELDVTLIAILPLAEGVLTGKYRVGGDPILPLCVRLLWLHNLIYSKKVNLCRLYGVSLQSRICWSAKSLSHCLNLRMESPKSIMQRLLR
ncbi:aldo/keto reductase [Paenibacillus albidus]|nr:aldo/keto reductase [Paenibacillus albidus]